MKIHYRLYTFQKIHKIHVWLDHCVDYPDLNDSLAQHPREGERNVHCNKKKQTKKCGKGKAGGNGRRVVLKILILRH